VKLCATQNLPLRGHRESIEQSENPRNFLAILKLLPRYDPVAARHLDYVSRNTRSVWYLSHESQNEFIELMGSEVRQHILKFLVSEKTTDLLMD